MPDRSKKIVVQESTRQQLLALYKSKKISLEGNILKLLDANGDKEFQKYIDEAIARDKDKQRKRLAVTKEVQSQNTELTKLNKENERMNRQLTKSLEKEEKAKNEAIEARNEAIEAKNEAEIARNEAEKARLEEREAKDAAEKAKDDALNDLEVLQKKTQFELMGVIIKVSLWMIVCVGLSVTAMYCFAIATGADTSVIGSTWTSMVGMLLSNSFSIVGTIMGIKHATRNKDES